MASQIYFSETLPMDLSEIVDKTPPVISLVFVCLVLGAIYYVFVSLPKAINAKYFPTVVGKITSSEVGTPIVGVGREGGDRVQTFTLDITYKYVVNGKTYSSKKRRWHEVQSSFHRYHDSIARKYPLGKSVTVYYNPNNPKVAVLEPGLGLGALMGLFILTLSIAFLTFFIHHRVYT
jgi:hypothetical protein